MKQSTLRVRVGVLLALALPGVIAPGVPAARAASFDPSHSVSGNTV